MNTLPKYSIEYPDTAGKDSKMSSKARDFHKTAGFKT